MNLDSGGKNVNSHTSDYISIFINCVNPMFSIGFISQNLRKLPQAESHINFLLANFYFEILHWNLK